MFSFKIFKLHNLHQFSIYSPSKYIPTSHSPDESLSQTKSITCSPPEKLRHLQFCIIFTTHQLQTRKTKIQLISQCDLSTTHFRIDHVEDSSACLCMCGINARLSGIPERDSQWRSCTQSVYRGSRRQVELGWTHVCLSYRVHEGKETKSRQIRERVRRGQAFYLLYSLFN